MKKKLFIQFSVSLGSFILLFLVLLFIDPSHKPLMYVLIPVVLAWVGVFYAAQSVYLLFNRRNSRLFRIFNFIGTSTLILLFLLSGVGQLSPRDMVLVITLALVSGFYVNRTWS